MIKYVRAFSRHDADKFVRGQHPDCAKIVRDFENRVAWIGCTESPVDRSPIEIHHGPISVHAFKDVNPDAYAGSGIIFELPMTEMQAQSMVAFVERFARAEHQWAILVHCMAGVARSGAIAEWVQKRHGAMRGNEFAALHRHCAPNSYVRRLLNEAGGAFTVTDKRNR